MCKQSKRCIPRQLSVLDAMKFDAAFVQLKELIPGWIGGWKESGFGITEN